MKLPMNYSYQCIQPLNNMNYYEMTQTPYQDLNRQYIINNPQTVNINY